MGVKVTAPLASILFLPTTIVRGKHSSRWWTSHVARAFASTAFAVSSERSASVPPDPIHALKLPHAVLLKGLCILFPGAPGPLTYSRPSLKMWAQRPPPQGRLCGHLTSRLSPYYSRHSTAPCPWRHCHKALHLHMQCLCPPPVC